MINKFEIFNFTELVNNIISTSFIHFFRGRPINFKLIVHTNLLNRVVNHNFVKGGK